MNRYLSFGAALVSQRSGHKFEMPRVESSKVVDRRQMYQTDKI